MVAPDLIQIRGLKTRFGSNLIHDGLEMSVREGEVLSIVGGSGTGKTVLLRQMLGLEIPYEGTICIFGQNIHQISAEKLQGLRNRWGMLFQHGALFSALTVLENVALPLQELRTLPADLIRDMAFLKLDMAGIKPAQAYKMPADLSGGMIKRVALARALALESELLFLDEPTAGLDPTSSDEFVELIEDLHRDLSLTVVMVTHDLDTLIALSDRIAVLADRKVVALGAIEDVIAVPHPFIQEYFKGPRGKRALTVVPNLIIP